MGNEKKSRGEEPLSYLEWRNEQFLETDEDFLLFLQ